jgi:hypothetical protein
LTTSLIARDVTKIRLEVHESPETDELDEEIGEQIVEFLKAESGSPYLLGEFLGHSHPQLMSNQASKDQSFKMVPIALPIQCSREVE